MLSYIHIKNIAIIEELEVEFNSGLNVLTGETGVGKSIIINAINFALGARTSKELIRKGAQMASCEMIFSLNDENVEEILSLENIEVEDNDIVISRTLSSSGRNIFKINGTVVSSSVMKDITKKIIDIHGQHEHQSLFDVTKHIEVLDRFDKKNINPLKEEIRGKYQTLQEIKKKITSMLGNDIDRERKIDILEYQINEIREAKLKLGEDEELSERRNIILNCDKILTGTNASFESLSIASDNIQKAISSLNKLSSIDEKFNDMSQSLNESEILVSDIKQTISTYMDDFYFNPKEQEEIENRLDVYDKLKRKYGSSIEEILKYLKDREDELDLIYNSEGVINKLKCDEKKLYDEIVSLSEKLSSLRKKAAKSAEEKIEINLKDLEMKNAKFEIRITDKKDISANGCDTVEFLFTSNLGENVKPLDKIASGGEISRVMLAIKNVLAGNDEIQILVFDEIDTGISGRAAQKVAEKMNELALEHQILCITHLPQIAAMADYHYEIKKTEKEDRTISSIELLDKEGDIKELARLVSGAELTDTAMCHAKELKNQAVTLKEKVRKNR